MTRIVKEKELLLDDAYNWILEDDHYASLTNWDESDLPPRRLLWIHGPGGTGKTMLMIGILRKLSDQPAAFAPTLLYFFCQSNTDLNSATAITRSLIWMLVTQQPHRIRHLQSDYYKSSGGTLFTDLNASVALSRVFMDMLEDARPVYFIVNALDECDQGLEELTELISTSQTPLHKVRSDVDALKHLKRKNLGTASTLVELNIQSCKHHIKTYIQYKLSDLKNSEIGYSYTDEILATVAKEVYERAENNFLWVSLVFNELRHMRGFLRGSKHQGLSSGVVKFV
jgi:hypothetical protein